MTIAPPPPVHIIPLLSLISSLHSFQIPNSKTAQSKVKVYRQELKVLNARKDFF